MGKVYTMGELLVEVMRPSLDTPLNKKGAFAGPFPSGAPGIFIDTVARLNHEALIWGGVGEDKFGECLLERLERDGVDCQFVTRERKGSTAVAFVAYTSEGEREFIYHIEGTPATKIQFDDSNRTLPAPDYFHVMGCSLLASHTLQKEIVKAVRHFSERGSLISFDPNVRRELLKERSFHEIAGEVLERTSTLLPGVDELLLCSGRETVEESLETLFNSYPKLEIVHLKKGKQGSTLYTRDESFEIPCYPIETYYPIVDPTGSGDCFDAAFICGLLDGKSLKDAGLLASKAGAINATALGPMEGDLSLIERDFV